MSVVYKGVLEVHSHAKNWGSPTQIAIGATVTVIEFASTEQRDEFAKNLTRKENIGDILISRVFHKI